MSQENLEYVRRGFEAMSRGDVDAVIETLHPEIEWQLPEGGLNHGTLRGHQAVRGLLENYIESFASLRVEPEQLFDAGDQVVAFVRLVGRGRSSGLDVNLFSAYLWTIEQGKAVRVQVFAEGENAVALEAAGLSSELSA